MNKFYLLAIAVLISVCSFLVDSKNVLAEVIILPSHKVCDTSVVPDSNNWMALATGTEATAFSYSDSDNQYLIRSNYVTGRTGNMGCYSNPPDDINSPFDLSFYINQEDNYGTNYFPLTIFVFINQDEAATSNLKNYIKAYTFTYLEGSLSETTYLGQTTIISTTPQGITGTSTSIGASWYVADGDGDGLFLRMRFQPDAYIPCTQSGAIYDAVTRCTGDYAVQAPFTVDITDIANIPIAGTYGQATTSVIFSTLGKWNATYEIRDSKLLGTYSTILISTTTSFIVGTSSPMDIAKQEIAANQARIASTTLSGIGKILASTTASWGSACTPFKSTFDIGDCLALTIVPDSEILADDLLIIKNTPPWGYAFRVIDLLKATSTEVVLPKIEYSFASSSPMAVMGDISFDPFASIADAGTLITEMKSDRSNSKTVWEILMPIVNIFVYMVLAFKIIHDITGVHSHEDRGEEMKK